jgi:CheY-like chemotaxis protein
MGQGKQTVLVIDDEPSVVTYLSTVLQDAGYDVVSAADGEEGFRVFEEAEPDLVSLDINMPKKSGMKLYREMREHPRLGHVPVIVVTAVTGYGGDPEEFRHFLDTRKHLPRAEGFVAKPIEPAAFVRLVGEVIRSAASA